ncbi:MAG: hypothetical protein P8103_13350 [Candidatus Thiodiazotropha sp.]|jgi:hypothetical protein
MTNAETITAERTVPWPAMARPIPGRAKIHLMGVAREKTPHAIDFELYESDCVSRNAPIVQITDRMSHLSDGKVASDEPSALKKHTGEPIR